MFQSVECPSRRQYSEIEKYFLWCPYISRKKLHNLFIKQLPKIMQKHYMNPDLQHALLSLIDTSYVQKTAPFTMDYVRILRNQHKLGNNPLFFCFFTMEWIYA